MRPFLILVVTHVFLCSHPLLAQVPDDFVSLWLITTTDGNEYVGELIEQTDLEVRLLTKNLGEITIRTEDIVSMEPVVPEKMLQLQNWRRHPHASRYFFSPNGYNLSEGEGYYQNTWVLLNQVSVGVTDYFSIGAGTIPLFLFAGTPTPVWLTPKFSIPVSPDRVNIGIGGLFGRVIGGGEGSSFGIAYGVSTFGSRDKNITVGVGYGFAGDEWSDIPLITVGGTTRIGKRAFLLTENYFASSEGEVAALISIGARSLAKTVSFDYGLFLPVATGAFVAIPWLSLTVPFGG
ncbi:MAG: hypothetical protein ACFB15_05995 [Cyclobacteriaceae bacterium]